MKKHTLSVVLATRNEKSNIEKCLKSVIGLADELIVVDEESVDSTAKIARSLGAKVYTVPHEENFHITKQKALDLAKGDWILQLDADESLTPQLSDEIKQVLLMSSEQIWARSPASRYKKRLFERHSKLIGMGLEQKGEVVAFLLPRRNLFLGKVLKHAGVYPDPAIRLVKKGKARFPCKSVHENMAISGKVAWLFNDLEHNDSPTFSRYMTRLNRYTNLQALEMKKLKLSTNYPTLLYFSFIKPMANFVKLYLLHKGFLDGMRGFVWSVFSSLHFPIAYFKYWEGVKT